MHRHIKGVGLISLLVMHVYPVFSGLLAPAIDAGVEQDEQADSGDARCGVKIGHLASLQYLSAGGLQCPIARADAAPLYVPGLTSPNSAMTRSCRPALYSQLGWSEIGMSGQATHVIVGGN